MNWVENGTGSQLCRWSPGNNCHSRDPNCARPSQPLTTPGNQLSIWSRPKSTPRLDPRKQNAQWSFGIWHFKEIAFKRRKKEEEWSQGRFKNSRLSTENNAAAEVPRRHPPIFLLQNSAGSDEEILPFMINSLPLKALFRNEEFQYLWLSDYLDNLGIRNPKSKIWMVIFSSL